MLRVKVPMFVNVLKETSPGLHFHLNTYVFVQFPFHLRETEPKQTKKEKERKEKPKCEIRS